MQEEAVVVMVNKHNYYRPSPTKARFVTLITSEDTRRASARHEAALQWV